ncbi:DUF6493 family protein [Actinoplanes sp. NPDC051861]|uniref:DUF7824 domain-containing protein n=1 Tax=Actinoplanes sp. NPDC051861 TaxID=3155170 RepID=UPI003449196C
MSLTWATLPSSPVAEMPAGISSGAELAEELAALVEDESGVRWERVLAALVTLERGEVAAVKPVLARNSAAFRLGAWGALPYLAEAVRAVLDGTPGHQPAQPVTDMVRLAWQDAGVPGRPLIETPADLLKLRAGELAVQAGRAPVPSLLATPTHVTGSIDPAVLIDRLARAEAGGWDPWALDFDQALLRVAVPADAAVLDRAGTLTSVHGRRLAAWLAGGGLPAPVSTRFEQVFAGVGECAVRRRVVARLRPGRTEGLPLHLEKALFTVEPPGEPRLRSSSSYLFEALAMALPHHREVLAAWFVADVAALADQDHQGAGMLPLLAGRSGPIGPATVAALAYGLCARHAADRVAAVDAFRTIAATVSPDFAVVVGVELGDLAGDGLVTLSRAVPALADLHQAGASAAVWEVVAAALPSVLPVERGRRMAGGVTSPAGPAVSPRGLPDLLELAARVAGAVGARGEIAGLAEVAGRGGSTRVVREARRLLAAIDA